MTKASIACRRWGLFYRPSDDNIVVTELADLDMIIICSRALDAVLRDQAEPELLDAVTQQRGMDIRAILFGAASAIGYLRWVNDIEGSLGPDGKSGLGLSFAKLRYNFISSQDLSCDEEKMLEDKFQPDNFDLITWFVVNK